MIVSHQNQIFFSILLLCSSNVAPLIVSTPPIQTIQTVLSKSQFPAQPRHHLNFFLWFVIGLFQFPSASPRPPDPHRRDKRKECSTKRKMLRQRKQKSTPRPCQILRFRSPVIARLPGPASKASKRKTHRDMAWQFTSPIVRRRGAQSVLASLALLGSSYSTTCTWSPCNLWGGLDSKNERDRKRHKHHTHVFGTPYLNVLLTCAASPHDTIPPSQAHLRRCARECPGSLLHAP